jgi:hypothetical protein
MTNAARETKGETHSTAVSACVCLSTLQPHQERKSQNNLSNFMVIFSFLFQFDSYLRSSQIDQNELVLVTDGQLPLRQCLHPSAGFKEIHLPPYYWKFSDLKKEVNFYRFEVIACGQLLLFHSTVLKLKIWWLIESPDTHQRSNEAAANASHSTIFVDISRDIKRWVIKGWMIVYAHYDSLKL